LALYSGMPLHFEPPRLTFDPQLENEVARWEGQAALAGSTDPPAVDRRSPFEGYLCVLTEEGGVLIAYTDLDCSIVYSILRGVAWLATVIVGARLIFPQSDLSAWPAFGCLTALGSIAWLIVNLKLEAKHSVEIRQDCMIIDGTDIFWAEDIGDNWPELQPKDGNPDRMVFAGIYGTRFIEHLTANRFDEYDRTPEVLAEDLKNAMEQLWGRREVTFAAAF
jgi:hypothetical protein